MNSLLRFEMSSYDYYNREGVAFLNERFGSKTVLSKTRLLPN